MEARFGPLERRGLVQQILAGSPQGLSIRDLTRILNDRGQRVTEKTVRRIVDALMAESGAIEELEPRDGTRGRCYRMKRGYKPETVVNLTPEVQMWVRSYINKGNSTAEVGVLFIFTENRFEMGTPFSTSPVRVKSKSAG